MNVGAAYAAGYTADQIIEFLVRELPHLGRRIRQAKRAGHDAKQIVEEIQGLGKDKLKKYDKKASVVEKGINPLIEAQEATLENSAETQGPPLAGKAALAAGALMGGLGAYSIARAAPAAVRGQLLPALGGQAGRQAPTQIGQKTINIGPAQIPVQRPQLPGPQAGAPPSPQPPTPGAPPMAPNAGMRQQAPQQMPPMPGPPTAEETALQNIEKRRAESKQLFELAKQPRVKKEHMTPFMRTARALIKKGDIQDEETFDHFRKYWASTDGKPRGSPLVEFEKFRRVLPRSDEGVRMPIPEVTAPGAQAPDLRSVPSAKGNQEPMPEVLDRETQETLPQVNERPISAGTLTPQQPINTPEAQGLKNKARSMSISEKVKGLQPQTSAMLPDGRIGTIESIKNGIAKIKVGGKEAHRKVEDLEEEPEDVKQTHVAPNLRKIIIDLSKVPEHERSAMLGMVQVPESKRDVTLKMGTGGFYRYWRKDGKPIDDATIHTITKEVKVPLTTGKTFMGTFSPSELSRGHSASKDVVHNAQRINGVDKDGNPIPDDPKKLYWSEPVDVPFLHGFYEAFEEALRVEEEEFNRNKAKEELATGERKKPRPEKEIPRKYGYRENDQLAAAQNSVKPAGQKEVAREDLKEKTAEGIPSVHQERANVKDIAFRPDLMQFKAIDEAEEGLSHLDEITGDWDERKAGILTVWEPTNPKKYHLAGGEKYIVVNGHHRLSKAKKSGVGNVRIQVLSEADGITVGEARAIGAEINIADGKGTIYDQVKFLREQRATHGENEVLGRARQIGAKGKEAATIALKATDNVYGAFTDERITPKQAEAIADAAPNDEALQSLGLLQAVKGRSPQEIKNFINIAKSEGKKQKSSQMDLFAFDDSAIKEMERISKKVATIQSEIAHRIQSASGAVRRPEKAEELGVSVKNLQGTKDTLAKLREMKDMLDNFSTYPSVVALIKSDETPAGIIDELQKKATH